MIDSSLHFVSFRMTNFFVILTAGKDLGEVLIYKSGKMLRFVRNDKTIKKFCQVE